MKQNRVSIFKLSFSRTISLLAGFLGSVVTYPAIQEWYVNLVKPPFTPPNWVFGPVWTTLYIFMGVALYLVWNELDRDRGKSWLGLVFGQLHAWLSGDGASKHVGGKQLQRHGRNAVRLFFVQLLLNSGWSLVFFGWKQLGLAFLVIVSLWLLITATIREFGFVNQTAAKLLVPYLAWVSFATYLNLGVWRLN